MTDPTDRPAGRTHDASFLAFAAIVAFVFTVAVVHEVIPVPGDPDDVTRGDPPEEDPGAAADRTAAWAARRPAPIPAESDDDADGAGFDVEPPDIIRLGWGWSQSRAEAIPTVCVEFIEKPRDAAQDSNIRISEVRDTYALSKKMNISASVSVKSVGGQGSAKASFAKDSRISSSAVTYLVDAEVMNSAVFAAPVDDPSKTGSRAAVRLTDDAAELALRDLERFQDICGEGYVSSIKKGARAYMLASTKTSSREDRETVRASVKGSGWGVKVSAAASGSSETKSARFERTMTYYQQGGSATEGEDLTTNVPAPTDADQNATRTVTLAPGDLPRDADEAILRISKLAYAAAKAGKIFEAHVTPYQVLENFPDKRDILAEEDEQDEIAAVWGAYATLYADLRDILEHPDAWAVPVRRCADGACETDFERLDGNPAAVAMVERLQDMTLIAQDQIQDAADLCIRNEEHCSFDAATVRSPYAVRASMPVLIPVVERPAAAPAAKAQADMTEAVSEISKSIITVKGAQMRGELAGRWERYLAADKAGTTGPAPHIEDLTPDDHVLIHLREPSQGRCTFGSRTPGCISNAEMRRWAERTGMVSIVTANRDTLKAEIETCAEAGKGSVLPGDGDDPDAPTLWYPPAVSVVGETVTCTRPETPDPARSGDGDTAGTDGSENGGTGGTTAPPVVEES